MKNRKKILTVLLAAILALVAAFFIFRFEHKKIKRLTPEQKIEEQNEITDIVEDKNKEEKQVVKSTVKDSIKIQDNKTNVKQAIKPTTKKGTVKVPILKTEENAPLHEEVSDSEENINTDDDGKDIIVPVKYVTRNTYKYIYTPTKFK